MDFCQYISLYLLIFKKKLCRRKFEFILFLLNYQHWDVQVQANSQGSILEKSNSQIHQILKTLQIFARDFEGTVHGGPLQSKS